MKSKLSAIALVLAVLTSPAAWAHTEPSAGPSELSALPVASVAMGANAASAAAGAVVALPLALSTHGAVLVVRTVEASARGTTLVLERASDGARASIEIAGRTAGAASLAAGAAVAVSVIGAGVILSTAGEVIAFIPNEIGKALLHNERLTRADR